MRKSAVGMAKSGARAGCGYGSVLAALLTLSVEFALAGTARPVPSVDAPRASLPLEFPWRAWRLFSSNDHLPNNLAYAIAQDETGEVYAGLGDGLARYDGASWERVALPGVRGVHAVGALLLGADHSLWVGTDGVGVFRVRGGNAEPVPGLSAEAGVVYALAAEGGAALKVPVAHGEGRYFADGKTLEELEMHRQIIYRYCDENGHVTAAGNPNGAVHNIAGICNKQRNVFGMMPHPERATNPLLGNEDGKKVFCHLFQLNYC